MCLARPRQFISLLFIGLLAFNAHSEVQVQTPPERDSEQFKILAPLIGTWRGDISGKPTEFILWENHADNSSLIGILIWGECISTLELAKISADKAPGREIYDNLRLSSKEYIFGITDELTANTSNRLQVDDNQCNDRPFWKKTLFTQQFFVSNNGMDQLRITKFPYRSFHSDIFRRDKPSSRLARGLEKAKMGSDLPTFKKALAAICNPSISYAVGSRNEGKSSSGYCALHKVFPVTE